MIRRTVRSSALASLCALLLPVCALAQGPTVSAPLTAPADWLSIDTSGLTPSNMKVFAAWKQRLDHPDVFIPNINVGYEKFSGDLDSFDHASIEELHVQSPPARILLHEKITICNGIAAWHEIYLTSALSDMRLHHEQITVAGGAGFFSATYTRAESQPDSDEARQALRTLCQPAVPAS